MPSSIELNIAKVQQRIVEAAKKYCRQPETVQLMAVSKTRTSDDIRLAAATGIIHIGENYLQEALDKIQSLSDLHQLCWHFIGPIQSNKTRDIAAHFNWVHSVDRLKIAQRLSQQRPEHLPALNICLQVNISREHSKAGVALEQLAALAAQVDNLPKLRLRGLMAIPAAAQDFAQQRATFAPLAKAYSRLQQCHTDIDTLSIGMSNDMEAAIAEGATIVRIGSDIFGSRTL
jgi:hypothetical protein